MTTVKEQADYLRKIADMMERGSLDVRQFNLTAGGIDDWSIHGPPAVKITILAFLVPPAQVEVEAINRKELGR